jgi:hypothetical protein
MNEGRLTVTGGENDRDALLRLDLDRPFSQRLRESLRDDMAAVLGLWRDGRLAGTTADHWLRRGARLLAALEREAPAQQRVTAAEAEALSGILSSESTPSG